jgi:hypothetical protein
LQREQLVLALREPLAHGFEALEHRVDGVLHGEKNAPRNRHAQGARRSHTLARS